MRLSPDRYMAIPLGFGRGPAANADYILECRGRRQRR
jgi:hypothetical protein